MAKRKFISIVLTIIAFSYFCIVICTVGQMCFKFRLDASPHSSFSDDPGRSERRGENEANTIPLINPIKSKLHNDKEPIHPDLADIEVESLSYQQQMTKTYPSLTDSRWPFFNCSTISRMKIRSKIGHGVAKETFVAEFQGARVAIKMVTRRIHLVRRCLEKLRGSHGTDPSELRSSQHEEFKMSIEEIEERKKEADECYIKPTARLMKEMLLSLQLRHHNLISLLGLCVRSEESETTDIAEHGVIGVYELGHRFLLDNLQVCFWSFRLTFLLDNLQVDFGHLGVPSSRAMFKSFRLTFLLDNL